VRYRLYIVGYTQLRINYSAPAPGPLWLWGSKMENEKAVLMFCEDVVIYSQLQKPGKLF